MRKKMIWTTLLIPLVVASLMMANVAMSSPDNTMYIDPPVVWDPGMPIGTEFTVNICVDYVFKLLIWQAQLIFDPTVIHGVSVEPGPFLSSAGGGGIWYPGIGFNNTLGVLYLVIEALPPPPGTPPPNIPSGGGVLAHVTFVKVGDGSSTIMLGPGSALINPAGDYIAIGGPFVHGWFSNEPGPELYVRRRGAHGTSGSWPEWTVGSMGDAQTLYCRILNYGTAMGADVYVEFLVTGGGETTPYTSNYDTIAAAPDVGEPSEVTVSASFTPDLPDTQYRVQVVLYFKAGGMTDYAAYTTLEETLGGEGQSRDIPVSFKTVP